MEDSKIKVGDWVYHKRYGIETVFQCQARAGNIVVRESDENIIRLGLKYCQRITPIEYDNSVKLGDRVAVISPGVELPEGHIGFITEIRKYYIVVDEKVIIPKDLALIPGQREVARLPLPPMSSEERISKMRCDAPLKVGDWDYQCDLDVVTYIDKGGNGIPGKKLTVPCPHPELEGVWVDENLGIAFRIEWNFVKFIEIQIGGNPPWKSNTWRGPGEGWTRLEQAPTASVNGGKLERPKKHGEPQFPWDPLGEG